MFNSLLFCEHCQTKVDEITQLHFVEEDSDRGFCSETCIMKFYKPYLQAFEAEENSLREKFGIEEQTYSAILGDKDLLDKALSNPDEVWHGDNDLGKSFYTHFLNLNMDGKELMFITICSYIESGPSFVYYRTVTEYPQIINHYRRDKSLQEKELNTGEESELDGRIELELPSEVIESLDLKKSSFLADLMAHRKDEDIEFEQFHLYDKYLGETLEKPDEIYAFEDDEGDILNTHIKSFKFEKMAFYYVVICFPYDVQEENKKALLPILTFPSIDNDLYPHYAKGDKLNEHLKN